MANTAQYDALQDQRAALIQNVIDQLGAEVLANPELAEVLTRTIDQGLGPAAADGTGPQPADGGLADLIGLGAGAPTDLGRTEISPGVVDYDDTLASERISSAADLYYVYLHERIGVFRVMWKLQELFRAGTLRISGGPGAFGLYRFDKRSVFRYRLSERMRAYRRVFGYTTSDPGTDARPNQEFDQFFGQFIGETAKYWRDKRISEVINRAAPDALTFGSIACVRRSGLDLRNNLKNCSYGNVNAMRVELSQALAEAFRVLDAPDLKAQFGADNPWDMIELVTWQYFHQTVYASTMNRMAVTGRAVLKWLAEPFILLTDRRRFETALYQIAEAAEEHLSSREALQYSHPTPPARNVYRQGPPPRGRRPTPPPRSVYGQGRPLDGIRRDPVFARTGGRMPADSVIR